MQQLNSKPIVLCSTRQSSKDKKYVGFCDAVLTGLAVDGGLLLPDRIPHIPASVQKVWSQLKFRELCFQVVRCFVTSEEISDAILTNIIEKAYSEFSVPECLELTKIPSSYSSQPKDKSLPYLYLLELFHGPSLAFKDFALRFIALLMSHLIKQKGNNATVLVATSGDTGAAAVSSFQFVEGLRCVVLYPAGKVSAIQELQMSSTNATNIYCIAVEDSTFNNCEAFVKTLLNSPLKQKFNLLVVNSINWARIVAQIVYHWYATLRVIQLEHGATEVDICVPTGNFGNILAAYYAKKMGAPIGKVIIASNVNGSLTELCSTGHYERKSDVRCTFSPAMDIQTSSNLERLLYNLSDNNGEFVKKKYDELHSNGHFDLSEPELLQRLQEDFCSYTITDEETLHAIAAVYKSTCENEAYAPTIIDPHTAVGYCAALKYLEDTKPTSMTSSQHSTRTPLITVATAHPSKFTDTIFKALPRLPESSLNIPDRVKLLLSKSHTRRYTFTGATDENVLLGLSSSRNSAQFFVVLYILL